MLEEIGMLNEVSIDVLKKSIKKGRFNQIYQSVKDPEKNKMGNQVGVTLGITDGGDPIGPETAYEELMTLVKKNNLGITPVQMKDLVNNLVGDNQAVSPSSVQQWQKALGNV